MQPVPQTPTNTAWRQTYVLRLQPAVDAPGGLAGEIEQVHSGLTCGFHDAASLVGALCALHGGPPEPPDT